MKVQDFIKAHNVVSVDLIKTKEGAKIPFIMKINTPLGVMEGIPSTKGWDKEKPTHVYPTLVDDIDQESGEIVGKKTLYVFSNNSGIDSTMSVSDFK